MPFGAGGFDDAKDEVSAFEPLLHDRMAAELPKISTKKKEDARITMRLKVPSRSQENPQTILGYHLTPHHAPAPFQFNSAHSRLDCWHLPGPACPSFDFGNPILSMPVTYMLCLLQEWIP
jgi:hypothetical protein